MAVPSDVAPVSRVRRARIEVVEVLGHRVRIATWTGHGDGDGPPLLMLNGIYAKYSESDDGSRVHAKVEAHNQNGELVGVAQHIVWRNT